MADTDIQFDVQLLKRIGRKRALLDSRRPMSKELLGRLREELRLAHTYNSNAIEGNTLTLGETKLVIEEGVTIGGKSLREHLEAAGDAEAFDLVFRLADKSAPLDHVTIQEIHSLVTKGQQADAGRYRTVNVRVGGAARSPPDFSKVTAQMERLFAGLKGRKHALEDSVRLHHGIARIHPFSDGNGRTARLASNLVLMRGGYPPIVLRKEDRKMYYSCLAKADAGDLGQLANFMALALDQSLTLYLASFGGKDALLPLSELAGGSPYSAEYLSLRARQGALSAVKAGKSWQSTRRALEEYIREHGRF